MSINLLIHDKMTVAEKEKFLEGFLTCFWDLRSFSKQV